MKRHLTAIIVGASLMLVGVAWVAPEINIFTPSPGYTTKAHAITALKEAKAELQRCQPAMYASIPDRSISGFFRTAASNLGVSQERANTSMIEWLHELAVKACEVPQT